MDGKIKQILNVVVVIVVVIWVLQAFGVVGSLQNMRVRWRVADSLNRPGAVAREQHHQLDRACLRGSRVSLRPRPPRGSSGPMAPDCGQEPSAPA
jgi:hypothetical protein